MIAPDMRYWAVFRSRPGQPLKVLGTVVALTAARAGILADAMWGPEMTGVVERHLDTKDYFYGLARDAAADRAQSLQLRREGV